MFSQQERQFPANEDKNHTAAYIKFTHVRVYVCVSVCILMKVL